MKDARGHGSNSRGGQQAVTDWRTHGGQRAAADWRGSHLAAHQSGVDMIGRLKKYGKIGAAIYAGQALAGTAAGIGWALFHTGVL